MKSRTYFTHEASVGSVAVKAVWLMLLPVAELFFLRHCLHSLMGLRIGFPGFTDYELFLPAPLGFFAFIWALEEGQPLRMRFSKGLLLMNLLVMGMFLGLNHYSEILLLSWGGNYWAAWLGLLTAIIGSGFGVWLAPKQVFSNPHKWALIPSLVMVFSLVGYMKYGSEIWSEAVIGLQKVSQWVLALVGNDTIVLSSNARVMRIHHPILTVYLGQGCGGFDGFLFFLAAFTIFAPIRWAMLSLRSWIFFGAGGLVLFAFLNGLRVVTLFSLAVIAGQTWGQETGFRVVLGIFHTHLGYLLYAGGLYAYFNGIIWIAELKKKPQSLEGFSFLKPQSTR